MKRRINTLIFIVIFLFLLSCSIAYSALSSSLSISGDLAYRKYSDIGLNVFFKIWQPNAFTVFLKGDQWCHSVRKDYAVPKIVRS